MDDIPDSQIEQVAMMEGILITHATGGSADGHAYGILRRTFLDDPALKPMLPPFVRTCRDLPAFWSYIKSEHGTYEGRRRIIRDGFAPVMDHLEGEGRAPVDAVCSEVLATFDAAGVQVVWTKAIARRTSDPEGAITMARTLLECVCKHILDERDQTYCDTDELPKLYGLVARALTLAPDQHAEEPVKAILGSGMNLVNGIGTLRNRLSDAHGKGARLAARPSPRHASLAVNTAGAVATFLIETHLERGDA